MCEEPNKWDYWTILHLFENLLIRHGGQRLLTESFNMCWSSQKMYFNNTYKELVIIICHLAAMPEMIADVLAPQQKNVAPLLLACLQIEHNTFLGYGFMPQMWV